MANIKLNSLSSIDRTSCVVSFNISVDSGSDWDEDVEYVEVYIDGDWKEDIDASNGSNSYKLTKLSSGKKHTIILYLVYSYWEKIDGDWEEIDTYVEESSEKIFYTQPEKFVFINCESGKQWLVENGINSLITNIEDFADAATAWKKWKNQSSQSSCPSFFSNDKITATQMNAVYQYVGLSEKWNSGDQISAAMFNNLANQIN